MIKFRDLIFLILYFSRFFIIFLTWSLFLYADEVHPRNAFYLEFHHIKYDYETQRCDNQLIMNIESRASRIL